jgi:branched-chain amino acid aminotransferase
MLAAMDRRVYGQPSTMDGPRNPLLVYMNGELVEEDRALIPVLDHSFLYGDGIFEGISVDFGRIFRLAEHVARLFRSAAYLRISPPVGADELRAAVIEVARSNGLRDGYIRVVLTRGTGPMGIGATRTMTQPNLVIIPQVRPRLSEEQRLERGLRASVVSTRRIPPPCLDPRVKTNNYLNNILAKFEQWDSGAEAAIMLDVDGYVSECAGENIFVVTHDVLRTPPALTTLDGITRRAVLELQAARGGDAREETLTVYDLYTAQEVFMTATLVEVAALTVIDGRRIGSGTAGPLTRALASSLRDAMAREGTPIDIDFALGEPKVQAG